MKKTAIIILVMALAQITYGQQIIYTISASQDDLATHLDSILFENLSNQTRFVVGNLPPLPAYDIDLSLELLVTSVSQVELPVEKAFRLVKNTPGEVGVQYSGNALEHVRLTMFNMAGQSVYAQTIAELNPQEIITVNIPSAGMYLLSIETKSGRVQYKAFGSTSGLHGTYNLSTTQQPAQNINAAPIATALKSSPLSDGFSYQIGDSIKVSVFLNGYYSNPHLGRILDSNHIQYEMHKDDGYINGYFTDSRDSQTYKWVKIGNQVWMAENLKYLPEVLDTASELFNTPLYFVYDYNGTDVTAAKATANFQNYGVLYNWFAVMAEATSSSANPSGVQGVCPPGWHVPSDAEWIELVNYVVSQGYPNELYKDNGAGNALKSCRSVGSPLGGACNTSDHPRWDSYTGYYSGPNAFGFSALPGGLRGANGVFYNIGNRGYWWSSTELLSLMHARRHSMAHEFNTVYRSYDSKDYGFSLRCVRDEAPTPTTYLLQLDVNPAGAGEVSGGWVYEAGESVSITATANAGYVFVNWTDAQDNEVSDLANFTYTMPSVPIILTAHFKQDSDPDSGTFTDSRDGQTYKWVKIGNQVWMAENLNFALANSWCYDNNATNCDHYGRLYSWAAVMNGASSSSANPSGVKGVCPTGWHVPSDAEWTELVNYVVSQGYPDSNVVGGAGNALKSCRQVGSPLGGACNTSDHPRWDSHGNHYGTDEFGFSALPGGYRFTDGSFDWSFWGLGNYGRWWSSTDRSSARAWVRSMYYDLGFVRRSDIGNKALGYSVRCVRNY